MKYIVLSTAVTDEIHFADGSCKERVPGGAGIYALAGTKLWHDDVGIVTGVGEDYQGLYGDWYHCNHLPTEGLIPKDPFTPHTVIQYFDDGERTETPRYGGEHYRRIEGTVADLERFSREAKGVYIFKNISQPFWQEALSLKKRHGFQLMWEIGADATLPENLAEVRAIASQLEALSINQTESMSLLGTGDLDGTIAELLSWNLPLICLRVGAAGAYALTGGKATLVPSIQGMLPVVDVTGGGNSFSGGAMVGWCETGDGIKAVAMGNASAAACIAQYGVPENIDKALRKKATVEMEKRYREVCEQ